MQLQVLVLSWHTLVISSTDYLIVIHLQHFRLFSFSWNFLLFWFLIVYYLHFLNSFLSSIYMLFVSLSSSSFLLNISASFLSGASPSSSAGKESACNVGDPSLISRSGRSAGEEIGYSLQYSGLENSMDCVVHGVAELDMTEQLSLISFSFLNSAPFAFTL